MQTLNKYKSQFEDVYISYYTQMKRFAWQYVIREEDAENIVQDIFLELWVKQFEFNSLVNLNGFLFKILKNRCIDFLRRKKLEQKVADEIQSEYSRTLKLNFESLELLDNHSLYEADIDIIIQRAIDNLPKKCREVFVMNKIERKKQKVIAEELNISVHTVESQMAIAYKKLKEALKDFTFISLYF